MPLLIGLFDDVENAPGHPDICVEAKPAELLPNKYKR